VVWFRPQRPPREAALRPTLRVPSRQTAHGQVTGQPGGTEAQVEEHIARLDTLRSRIREEHARLDGLDPRDREYEVVARRVFDAANALLEYEDRLPVLLDEPRHRLSVILVRSTGAATAVVAGGLALSAVPGWITVWWTLLLVPLAVLGVAVALTRVRPPASPHREQRTGACIVAGATLVVGVTVLGLLPRWGAAAGVAVALAGMSLIFGGPVRVLGSPSGDGITLPRDDTDTGEIPVVTDAAARSWPGSRRRRATWPPEGGAPR